MAECGYFWLISVGLVTCLSLADLHHKLLYAFEKQNLMMKEMKALLERMAAQQSGNQPLPTLVLTEACHTLEHLQDLDRKLDNLDDRNALVH